MRLFQDASDTNRFNVLYPANFLSKKVLSFRFNPSNLRLIRSRLEAAYDCGCGWGDYCDANENTDGPVTSCIHNMKWVQDQLVKRK